jgi:hypothetical protein
MPFVGASENGRIWPGAWYVAAPDSDLKDGDRLTMMKRFEAAGAANGKSWPDAARELGFRDGLPSAAEVRGENVTLVRGRWPGDDRGGIVPGCGAGHMPPRVRNDGEPRRHSGAGVHRIMPIGPGLGRPGPIGQVNITGRAR